MSLSIPVISYPAGKCPVKLKGTSYDEVIGWAEEIFCVGRNNNIIYLPSAIAFFAQQFYRMGTSEYKIVCDYLIEQYGSINYYEEEIHKFANKPILNNIVNDEKPKRRGRKSKEEKERLERIEKINLEIKERKEKEIREVQEAKLENKPEKKTIKIKKKKL